MLSLPPLLLPVSVALNLSRRGLTARECGEKPLAPIANAPGERNIEEKRMRRTWKATARYCEKRTFGDWDLVSTEVWQTLHVPFLEMLSNCCLFVRFFSVFCLIAWCRGQRRRGQRRRGRERARARASCSSTSGRALLDALPRQSSSSRCNANTYGGVKTKWMLIVSFRQSLRCSGVPQAADFG